MKKNLRYTIYFILITAVAGCGLTTRQIVQTQSFGSATASIGRLGEEEFINIRNGIIEMNMALVAIDNSKNSASLKFDAPASAEATAMRVAAAKALKLYGELLVRLVTEDQRKNLQNAASALLDNINGVLRIEIPEEKKDALRQIIVNLGSPWVKKKRAEAAREIIPVFRQPVNELADLLSADFSLNIDSPGFLKAYETTAKRLKNASMRLVNAGSKYTVLERDRAVEALVLAEKAIIRADKISKKTKRALNRLKSANEELVRIIREKNHSTDDIILFAEQIQELVNMYQVLAD